jgi:hypothetical protein
MVMVVVIIITIIAGIIDLNPGFIELFIHIIKDADIIVIQMEYGMILHHLWFMFMLTIADIIIGTVVGMTGLGLIIIGMERGTIIQNLGIIMDTIADITIGMNAGIIIPNLFIIMVIAAVIITGTAVGMTILNLCFVNLE